MISKSTARVDNLVVLFRLTGSLKNIRGGRVGPPPLAGRMNGESSTPDPIHDRRFALADPHTESRQLIMPQLTASGFKRRGEKIFI